MSLHRPPSKAFGNEPGTSPALMAEIRDQVEHGRALIASTRVLLEGRRDMLRKAADSVNPLHRDRRFYGETRRDLSPPDRRLDGVRRCAQRHAGAVT